MDDEAVTIRQAAERLSVTPQRVSQMLRDHTLDGPPQPGGRAPRNVPRVYLRSLSDLETRRAGRSVVSQPRVRESLLRDDAHRLKLALDIARDQLSRQRQQNERLTTLLAETVAALQDEQALARQADRITEECAALATNHLAPDSPPAG